MFPFHLYTTFCNFSLISAKWKQEIFSQVVKKMKEQHRGKAIEINKLTSNENFDANYSPRNERNNKFFDPNKKKRNYSLGEPLQSKHDFVHEKSINNEMVHKLQVKDCAFIKRSDRSWTYALLIKRCYTGGQRWFGIRSECRAEETEVMTFALDPSGHKTKSIMKEKWAKFIKCESPKSSFAANDSW